MEIGKAYGERSLPGGIGTFVRDDGGYTVVAVAVALLVCLTLTFSLAGVQWMAARAADVQEVADAAAMAGSNAVAMVTTIAQVLDACVLSLGLLGTVICGAGLVVAAIPFLQTHAMSIVEAGTRILDARRSFATSAAKGLSTLESALPALVAANAASCVYANNLGSVTYRGVAVPLPLESETDYSFLKTDVDQDELVEAAQELAEASTLKEEALREESEQKERAWKADNVDDPHCMRSRAESLAGLSGASNPTYPSVASWQFEYARLRASNYYLTRYLSEPQAGSNPDELQRSCARKVFYGYAWDAVGTAVCIEDEEFPIIDLPSLPKNASMVRETSLYTDELWPCTYQESGVVLHCSRACPAATGASAGSASLAQLESGAVRRCATCQMDVVAMGNVAAASTSINNGFEYYWQIVVDASEAYVAACEKEAEATEKLRAAEEKSETIFEQALRALSVDRPSIKPAGRYGCVAVVVRDESQIPNQLLGAFLAGGTLPVGAAVSAAALAPEETTDGRNILSELFAGVTEGSDSLMLDLVGNITGLWGDLLVSYGAGYKDLSERVSGLLDNIGGVFGEELATKLKSKIVALVKAIGFEPTDMRQRKPVLVNSQQVLSKAGFSQGAQVRAFIQSLPDDPAGQVNVALQTLRSELGPVEFTIAELPIPGTELTIPLTVSLDDLLGAS